MVANFFKIIPIYLNQATSSKNIFFIKDVIILEIYSRSPRRYKIYTPFANLEMMSNSDVHGEINYIFLNLKISQK